MEAIRQIVKVKNHKISITLPENFNASEVEVIIFPKTQETFSIPNWQMDEVRERTEAYLRETSIGQNFDDAMKEIEDEV